MPEKTQSPFNANALSRWVPVIVAVILHTATVVWWAATINAKQTELADDMTDLVEVVKDVALEQKKRTGLVYSVDAHDKEFEKMNTRITRLEARYVNPLKP